MRTGTRAPAQDLAISSVHTTTASSVSAALAVVLLAASCVPAVPSGPTPVPATPSAPAPSGSSQVSPGGPAAALPAIGDVHSWLYLLDTDLDDGTLAEIEASAYDMVVIDFISSQAGSADYPMAEAIARLHRSPHPKIVLAYLNIGEAEDYRAYWQPGWQAGNPEWMLRDDPEGWLGDFPVAYWHDEWREIWLGQVGLIRQVVDAGFDGMYLDWVEAYDDEAVIAAAAHDAVDPRAEMVRWVGELASAARTSRPGFLVIAQNAASLLPEEAYALVLDGVAQEQIWFDGGPDDHPPGDCPLPRMEAEVDSDAYVESLSPACRRLYADNPDGTLHTSTEEYLDLLSPASKSDLPVFTVDYAVEPANVAWIYAESRRLGWIPYVSNRALDTFLPRTP